MSSRTLNKLGYGYLVEIPLFGLRMDSETFLVVKREMSRKYIKGLNILNEEKCSLFRYLSFNSF